MFLDRSFGFYHWMTLEEFNREQRRLMRQPFPERNLNTFDFAIGRANFEIEQIRKLIGLTPEVQHPRIKTIRASLERKLIKLEKSRDRFQKLKGEDDAKADKNFWKNAKPQ
jgi:hypothetical protein